MGRKTDFSKLVIYKIRCNDPLIIDFYVGSTTCFKTRKNQHKTAWEKGTQKIYEVIRENGGWSNWTMVEIEIYPCNSSTEARIREEYWRVELQASLNTIRAYRSKDELKIQRAQYHQEHKEEINKKKALYREKNKEENKIQRVKNNQDNYQRHKNDRKLKYLKNRYGVIFDIANIEIPTELTDEIILEIKYQISQYL
jgi:hypothetical protein